MTTLDSTFFEIEIDGPVAHLIMNRPNKANGMSPDFWQDLPRLTRQLENDRTIRAMVISGKGKHFTGGMDLASFGPIIDISKGEPGRAAYSLRKLVIELQDSFSALEQASFPVIAAIHGACIGGGIDMISACDLRLASADAQFSIEEINIGMTADVGTLQRLPKLISPAIVKELAYTGRRFSAQEAKEWGFVSRICDNQESLLTEAMEMAHIIASKSPLGNQRHQNSN